MPSQAQVTAIYLELQANTAKLKQALHEATNETKNFARDTKVSMQESRESIELLGDSIGVRLPRALQRYVAELPGVATAMSAAFNGIAIIGIIQILTDAGRKVAEFIEKNKEAAQKNAEANQKVLDSLILTNAQLTVANDKIADNIAHLEHQPKNALKDALDDATLSAIQLSKQLEDTIEKQRQLLDATTTGQISQIFGMVGPGNALKPGRDQYQAAQTAEDTQYEKERAKAKNIDDLNRARTEHDKRRVNITNGYWNTLNGQLSDRQEYQALRATNPDTLTDAQRQRFMQLNAELGPTNGDQTKYVDTLKQVMGNVGVLAQIQNAQANGDIISAKENALTQQNEAAIEALKKLQLEHDKQKVNKWQRPDGTLVTQPWTSQDEAAFWSSHLKDFNQTTQRDQYNAVLQKMLAAQEGTKASPIKQYLSEQAENAHMVDVGKNIAGGMGKDASKAAIEDLFHLGERWRQYNEQVQRASEITAANAAAMEKARIELQLQTGQITTHDAALKMAVVHEREYQDQLTGLQNARTQVVNDQTLQQQNPAQYAAAIQSIDNQIAQLKGRRDVEVMQEQAAEQSASAMVQLRKATMDLAEQFTDTGRQIAELVTSTLSNLNASLSGALMAHTHSGREYRQGIIQAFSNTARGAGQQGLNDVFQQAEGAGLKKLLGFNPNEKKPKGTASDPLYVKNAESGTDGQSSGGGVLSGILGKLFGSKGSSILNLGSGGMGSLGLGSLPSIFSGGGGAPSMDLSGMDDSGMGPLAGLFGGGFAAGGDVMAGVPIDVGELGPERFVPYTNGQIIPNNQLKGSSGIHIEHIDARGSHDPAQVEAAVHRALGRYGPHVAAGAASANKERNARRPATARE